MNKTLAILICLTLPSTAFSAVIRLHTAAVAAGEQVRLEEIATVSGLEPAAGSLVVARLNEPGASTQVTMGHVVKALTLAGHDVVNLRVSGAARCHVRRAAESRNDETTPLAEPELDSDKEVTATFSQPATAAVEPANGDSLGKRIAEQLAEQFNVPVENVAVRFDLACQGAAGKLPAGEVSISSTDRSALGRRRWRVDIIDGNRSYRQYLTGTASVSRSVVMAVRDIPAGATLQAEDVELVLVNDDGARRCMTSVSAVIGLQTRQSLRAGEAVEAESLTAPVLVSRGQSAEVMFRAGQLSVKLNARALSDGREGERIEFENMSNRNRLWAVVTGPGQAQVASAVEGRP